MVFRHGPDPKSTSAHSDSSSVASGPLVPASPSLSTCWDHATRSQLERMYRAAWSASDADINFAAIRDEILASRHRINIQVLTLHAVTNVVHSTNLLADDERWATFFELARAIEADEDDDDENSGEVLIEDDSTTTLTRVTKKRKRKSTNNSGRRDRNLAVVAALWSPRVVEHYGWVTASNELARQLRLCATNWPNFVEDVTPRLCIVQLHRHCESLRNSRVRGIHEVPLQMRDFTMTSLAAAKPDFAQVHAWIHSDDGAVRVDNHGALLKDLRPTHFHNYLLGQDQYGVLVPRISSSDPCTPSIESSTAASPSTRLSPSLWGLVQESGNHSPFNIGQSSARSVDLSLHTACHIATSGAQCRSMLARASPPSPSRDWSPGIDWDDTALAPEVESTQEDNTSASCLQDQTFPETLNPAVLDLRNSYLHALSSRDLDNLCSVSGICRISETEQIHGYSKTYGM